METDCFNEDIKKLNDLRDSMDLSKRIMQKIDAGQITKFDLAEELGITRVTLDTRLQKDNWKKGEKVLLKSIA